MKKEYKVAIIMGSDSDRDAMDHCGRILSFLKIPYEMEVMSAHRDPDRVDAFAREAEARGIKVVIAGAGMAAALPGVVAARTLLPVIGVPLAGSPLNGQDALYSIVQMPPGIPVATVAIGSAGAKNAAVLAAEILALTDPAIRERLVDFRSRGCKI
ncbi:MAG TPA: 5-(carboxyamino)imidazole ribonucleotide mutase [bacterium]|nr:5-(carboxyamino)imidazole ribonucleotide mutase [bacterium]